MKSSPALVIPISHSRKEEINIDKLLRDLCAAGIVLTSLVPEASRWFIFLPVVLFWVLFSYVSNPKAFNKAFLIPDIKAYSIYLWLVTYTIFYFAGYMHGTEFNRLINYYRLGFSLLIFNYYLETSDIKAVKRIIVFALMCVFVVCIMTLRGIALDPMAARVLATGREDLMQGLTGMTIGSYGFIYGLVFLSVAIIGLIKTNLLKTQKIVFAVIVVLAIYTIFSAAFMMALLLLVTTFILLLFNVKKASRLFGVFLLILILIFFLTPVLYNALSYLGDIVMNPALSQRLQELAFLIRFGGVEGTENMDARLYFLTLSIGTFLANPILGIGGFYGFETSVHGIGGHSALFDELAKYGIFGAGALLVALYSNARFVYRRLIHDKQKLVYFCSMSAFFILGAINTLLFVPIIFMAYFVVPGLIWSFSEINPAKNSKKNEHPLVR